MMMMVIESETNSNVVTVFEIKTTKPNPNPVIYMCIHETVITVEICYNGLVSRMQSLISKQILRLKNY